MNYIKYKLFTFSALICLATIVGCNRDDSSPQPANDMTKMGQADLLDGASSTDQGRVCDGKPQFILFPGGYEFVPQSATLCPMQQLQMCGANVACADTTILIGGEVAPIVQYPSTSEPCVIVSMPQQLLPMVPDAGERLLDVQASNPFGSMVASHKLRIIDSSCP